MKLAAFILYICAVFYFTGAGTMFDLLRYGIQLDAGQINLLPFSEPVDIVACFLNVLLFVPFGFLLPYIGPDSDDPRRAVLYGASFSLLIELSQLFNNRRTDIDDLLLNTLGMAAGYLLFRIYLRMIGRTVHAAAHSRFEPAIYILAAFMGRFLLFDEFGLAKVLYGF